MGPFAAMLAMATALLFAAGCDRKKSVAAPTANSIGMIMAEIPAGSFRMGSIEEASQMPVHEVAIPRPFLISATTVTQRQWEDVMGTAPWIGEGLTSAGIGPDCPAVNMTIEDAWEFCRRLGAMEGKNYRLPSEAEWEYSARAGSTGLWFFGDSPDQLDRYAWHNGNSKSKGHVGAHPVALLKPNPFGLYDVYGNVWELCEDNWQPNYNGAPTDSSAWRLGGKDSDRVMRGGSHHSTPQRASSPSRINLVPSKPYENVGFRIVCDISKQ